LVELSLPVQVLDELVSSPEQTDPDMVMVLSKRALDAHIDPADIVENGIAKGLRRVGERFENGEASSAGWSLFRSRLSLLLGSSVRIEPACAFHKVEE
jgi:methanogenic corrinoid protein MtbC1